jgi:hypothetical protein
VATVLYRLMDWLGIAWRVISCFDWVSLVLMLAAVGICCQYMIQTYKHPRHRNLDRKRPFFREGRPRLALAVFCFGLGLQAAAIVLANVVPGRH